MKKGTRYLLLILLLAFLCLVLVRFLSVPKISIILLEEGNTSPPRHEFLYESLKHPLLKQLREQEGLEGIVSGAASEREAFVLLTDWASRLWTVRERGCREEPYCNSLNILKRIRRGDLPGGLCSEQACVLMQACLSLGHQARILSLESAEGSGHRVVEVWSNEFNRWFVLDPFNNIHYERGGIPLNALELHQALVSNRLEGILPAGRGAAREGQSLQDLLRPYRHLSVIMRNNHLSLFDQMLNRRSLGYRDPFTDGRPSFSMAITGEGGDLYWPLNQTRIEVRSKDKSAGTIGISFVTNTPGFSRFEVRRQGGQTWDPAPSTLTWRLGPGENILEARAVNILGVAGPAASMKVRYGKP